MSALEWISASCKPRKQRHALSRRQKISEHDGVTTSHTLHFFLNGGTKILVQSTTPNFAGCIIILKSM
jgi:hypothetical protein